jgi:hypothetical protein
VQQPACRGRSEIFTSVMRKGNSEFHLKYCSWRTVAWTITSAGEIDCSFARDERAVLLRLVDRITHPHYSFSVLNVSCVSKETKYLLWTLAPDAMYELPFDASLRSYLYAAYHILKLICGFQMLHAYFKIIIYYWFIFNFLCCSLR